MILKIQEPVLRLKPIQGGPHKGECMAIPDGWKWFVFGELEEVSWHDQLYQQEELSGEDGPPRVHIDRWFIHPSPSSDNMFQVVAVKSIHGKEQNFAFNTTAYLCNDRGDTVEKISVGKFISWGAQGDGPKPWRDGMPLNLEEQGTAGFVRDVLKNNPKERRLDDSEAEA